MMHHQYRQNIKNTADGQIIPTENNKTATVQAAPDGAAWGTAVMTLKRSNDGKTFVALETPTTISAGGGMTSQFSVAGFAYLRVDVTTAEGSSDDEWAIVTVCMKDNS